MEGRIKSALEIALEKAARLGKLTPEEASELKWVPEGERLAALYLRGQGDLARALSSLEREAAVHVQKGAVKVLLANLDLPRTEAVAATNRRVLQGLQALAKDKKALKPLTDQVTYVAEQYANYGRQQLERSRQALREQLAAQVQQELRQRGATAPARMDIESLPQFQAQWRALIASVEKPYLDHLERCREQLRRLLAN